MADVVKQIGRWCQGRRNFLVAGQFSLSTSPNRATSFSFRFWWLENTSNNIVLNFCGASKSSTQLPLSHQIIAVTADEI